MKKAIVFLYVAMFVINIAVWGFIYPYLNSVNVTAAEDISEPTVSVPETEPVHIVLDIPIETIYDTETISTEPTVPCTTVPPKKEIVKDYSIEYSYGERVTPSVEIDTSSGIKNNTNDVNTDEFIYLGKYTITGYTPKCKHCCGSDKGITASGVQAIPGYTVATHKSIPFGTTLYIEGYGYYVVEDRGVGRNHIDVAANNHEECYSLTNTKVNVYIVPYIREISE